MRQDLKGYFVQAKLGVMLLLGGNFEVMLVFLVVLVFLMLLAMLKL